jgi:hypothetical protein
MNANTAIAEAEQEYIQITDEAVREMTLNQLTSPGIA